MPRLNCGWRRIQERIENRRLALEISSTLLSLFLSSLSSAKSCVLSFPCTFITLSSLRTSLSAPHLRDLHTIYATTTNTTTTRSSSQPILATHQRRPGAPSFLRAVSSFTLFSSSADSHLPLKNQTAQTRQTANLSPSKMSFPFRRRESSPHSDDDYPNGRDGSPNGRFAPWKSSAGRRQGVEVRRVTQVIGGIVVVGVVVWLVRGLFGGGGGRKDPFEIMERTPTTK